MYKIKAKVYDGPEKPEQCFISKEAYIKKPGLEYFMDGRDADGKDCDIPVSPAQAQRAGFKFSEAFGPPASVRCKNDLSAWLDKGLGLKNTSENYRKLYSTFSPLYEFHEVREGRGYN